MSVVIGIDPGLSGAIAILDAKDWSLVVHDMPTLRTGVGSKRELDLLALTSLLPLNVRQTVVEKVHAMPGQGVTSMFNFGMGYGALLGLIAAFEHPHSKVTPQRWKKDMGVTASKDGARARASELMPLCSEAWKLKNHDGRAEAALIAFWWASKNIKYPESITYKE